MSTATHELGFAEEVEGLAHYGIIYEDADRATPAELEASRPNLKVEPKPTNGSVPRLERIEDALGALGEALNEAAGSGKDERVDEIVEKIEGLRANDRVIQKFVTNEVAKLRKAVDEIGVIRIQVTTPDGETKLSKGILAHKMLPTVVFYSVEMREPVLLVGPAGSGKTTMAEQIAEALDLPYGFTGKVSEEYKLLGYTGVDGTLAVRTVFREIWEHGGVFLLDEADGSEADALLAINAALANGYCDFPDGRVDKHPDCIVLLAANTYGRGADRQYVGRNELDAATLDRFVVLDMDYDEDLERKLVGDDKVSQAWLKDVLTWRRAAAEHGIRHIISPRASMRGAKALRAGRPRKEVEDALVWKGLDAAQVKRVKGAA